MASEDQKSAIDFIDILFALVIGSALEVLPRSGDMSAAGRTHLTLATLLTIMSWIGYHNSDQRYSAKITFDLRRPRELTALGKFLIDVALVVVYWLAVQTTEGGFANSSSHPSWHSTTLLTSLSFVGYAIWDLLAWLSPRSEGSRGLYLSWRRTVTIIFLLLVGVAWLIVSLINPQGDHPIAAVDGILCVAVVGFRVLKDMESARFKNWDKRRKDQRTLEDEQNQQATTATPTEDAD